MNRLSRRLQRATSLVLAAAVVLSVGCATTIDPQSAAATVPYRHDVGGRMIVDVSLNGRGPYAFLIDTGASISGVSESLARRLELTVGPGGVLLHGMTTSDRVPVTRVARMQLGAVEWQDVRVAVLPDDHSAIQNEYGVASAADGILGTDVLSQYAAGFATRERILRLYRPEFVSAARYVGWRAIELQAGASRTPAGLMMFFDLDIEGSQARALFDLGAGFNVINWAAAEQLGLTPERFARRVDILTGVFEPLPRAPRFVAVRTQTGEVAWRDEVFTIADLQIFATFELDERPAAIIGAGLFGQRDFLIDFSTPRILVSISGEERSKYLHK